MDGRFFMKRNVFYALLMTAFAMMMFCIVISAKSETVECNKQVDLLDSSASPETRSDEYDENLRQEDDLFRHIEYIKSELDRFDKATAYFEKYGISLNLRDYVEKNNLDTSLPELKELVRINEEHISRLLENEKEYDEYLKNNAVIFIDICNNIQSLSDYSSIKDECEEARFYFFNMDVSVEGVQGAIDVYYEKLQQVVNMEKKAEIFIDAVNVYLDAIQCGDLDTIAARMIVANRALSEADMGISGVAEASAELKNGMSEYNKMIMIHNKELSIAREITTSLMSYNSSESLATIVLDAINGGNND